MVELMKLNEGKITLCEVPIIFTFTKSMYYMQKELEKMAGEAWKRIFYDCGKIDGIGCNSNYVGIFHNDPEFQKIAADKFNAFSFCVDEFNKLGKGRLEIITTDKDKPLFVLRYYFSPIALAYLEHERANKPVCYHFAGVFAGAANVVYPGIEVIETKCFAKGDPYCEFIFEIPKNR
ncbi:MAG: hypothetical protein Sv326_1091 [Candidatus Fermentimicrarchaeum limneticum]|uniref:4-vinyl reductase 4VR domain-containing protein n=1 Tax=Fermentimicrarchaeum limneticum TaxID=2795018 RepID=A0A7D5XM11_FERL1|nr:MAG: hypothetical protein Sv326_1091 [Candidatus Fermentimicrarchaeum limneticum]